MTELTREQGTSVMALISKNARAIQSVLPKHLTFEKMARIAYHCVEVTPALALCNQKSLFNAILEASSLGLEVGGPLGLAHLIPFGKEVKLIIDYKGFMHMASNSNIIISYEPVYEKDYFVHKKGLNPVLEHEVLEGDRGNLVGAYAIAFYPDGRKDFEVVDRTIAMAAKQRSPAKNKKDSPWNKTIDGVRVDEWVMWCKTAVRRLAKRTPKSPELQRAAIIDEKGEAGISQGLEDHVLDIELEDLPQDETAGDLTDKIKNGSKAPEQTEIDNAIDKQLG